MGIARPLWCVTSGIRASELQLIQICEMTFGTAHFEFSYSHLCTDPEYKGGKMHLRLDCA